VAAKPSLACATAIALADLGKTGAAGQHRSRFESGRGARPENSLAFPPPIPGVEGLRALNIDPDAAAQAYRDRIVGSLSRQAATGDCPQHGGAICLAPCTMEIAAFGRFARLLGEPAAPRRTSTM